MTRNYYKILGVATHATSDEIKAAYRRLAALHHPDKEGGDPTRMAEINQANDVLSNPARRDAYDKGHNDHVQMDVAKNLVVQHFIAAIADVTCLDPIERTRARLSKVLGQIEGTRRTAQRERSKLEAIIKLIKFRGEEDTPPLLPMLLEARIAHLTQSLTTCDSDQKDVEVAQAMLGDYTWEGERIIRPAFFEDFGSGQNQAIGGRP